MSTSTEDDIMLKLLHTADWHLGRTFRNFSEDGSLKLSRARLEVVDKILLAADRASVDAILCAGDLFDDPCPDKEWWMQLAATLKKSPSTRPIFLLPGNHDPLTSDSIWAKNHPFRMALPPWAQVIDRENFEYTFPNGAVLYAVPCMSKAGQRDPTESIQKREPGDERIRIGMVHGSTFDAKDFQTNFPIDTDAALARGLDYLAIGDTHGFRYIPAGRHQPPMIYPGAPEPTAFDERDAGFVAVVFINRQRLSKVRQERVARWTWEELSVKNIAELRELVRRNDLADRVLRLHLEMVVPAPEFEEAELLIEELTGTPARHGKVGVLDLDRQGLALQTSTVDQYCLELPDVLQAAVRMLKVAAENHDVRERLIAERALFHLYRTSKKMVS